MGRVLWVDSWCWASTLGVALGCAANESDPTSNAPGYYCEELCSKRARCGERLAPECAGTCERDPWLRALEPHMLVAVADCLSNQHCAVFYDDATWEKCFDPKRHDLVQSDTCFDYCEAFGAHVFECGGASQVDEVQESCIEDWGCTWSDEWLERGFECFEPTDCNERTACMERAFSL